MLIRPTWRAADDLSKSSLVDLKDDISPHPVRKSFAPDQVGHLQVAQFLEFRHFSIGERPVLLPIARQVPLNRFLRHPLEIVLHPPLHHASYPTQTQPTYPILS